MAEAWIIIKAYLQACIAGSSTILSLRFITGAQNQPVLETLQLTLAHIGIVLVWSAWAAFPAFLLGVSAHSLRVPRGWSDVLIGVLVCTIIAFVVFPASALDGPNMIRRIAIIETWTFMPIAGLIAGLAYWRASGYPQARGRSRQRLDTASSAYAMAEAGLSRDPVAIARLGRKALQKKGI